MKTMEQRILEQIEATNKVQAISFVALTESGQIDAKVASAHKEMFEEWKPGMAYKTGQVRKYNDVLYRIVNDHTSQGHHLPPDVPSLYDSFTISEDGYENWEQPAGAHNAYSKGKIVSYNGKLYKSLIDNNAYSPEEYPAGWEEVIE